MAPAASASVPMPVPVRPRSWMMRASTGNAVIDSDGADEQRRLGDGQRGAEEAAGAVQRMRRADPERERRQDAGDRDRRRLLQRAPEQRAC